jgi:hypothetical protein
MASPGVQFTDEVRSGIDASVGGYPDLPVEARRLLTGGSLVGVEQRMTESHGAIQPDILAVGPADGHGVGHPPEQSSVDARAVEMDDSGNATHAPLIGRSLETISRHP